MSIILNINTKFRNNYNNTNSTDFIYNLPYLIKNVKSMEYLTSEFSNVPYLINCKMGSNNFKITDKATSTTHNVIIQEGNYSGIELAAEIKTKIADLNLTNHDANNYIDVSFNNQKKKFIFTIVVAGHAVNDLAFDLDFTYNVLNSNDCKYCSNHKTIDEQHLTFGWLIGFRKKKYLFADDYKTTADTQYGKYLKGLSSEGVYDRNGSRYYLLVVNDYNNNHRTHVISSYQKDTLTENNILSKFKYVVDPDYHSIDTDTTAEIIREYNGKVDINRLHIKLLDEYGRIVDLDSMDYSITLKLETE